MSLLTPPCSPPPKGRRHPCPRRRRRLPPKAPNSTPILRTSASIELGGIAACPDAAKVVTVFGKTAVLCGGSVPRRVVHIGPAGESELVLAHLAEGMYDALSQLVGGSTYRNMILDNLELVFLLIDKHCDGGIILETDGHKLTSSVLLRDEQEATRAEEQAQSKGGKGGLHRVLFVEWMGT
eukprot:CCRYP_003167-RA/>CCRYP_003167-RA protein AED:0.09 eAED:0.05 QI:0/0/0/1/0/0/2/0/180